MKRLRIVVVVVCMALFTAACTNGATDTTQTSEGATATVGSDGTTTATVGSDGTTTATVGSDGTTTATVSAPTQTSEGTACGTPTYGGTFITAAADEPGTLTQLGALTLTTALVIPNVFNQLVIEDFDLGPAPDLADSWEISEDGRIYTFHLNPDATWHDGEPVTADDVVFSYESIWSINSRLRGEARDNIESVVAADDHTVVFTLLEPFAPLMNFLGDLNALTIVYPEHIYGQHADAEALTNDPVNRAPIGSGAFEFSEWVQGSHIELVRNDDYFKEGLPYLDRLIFQFLPDESARTLAFENGDVDFLYTYLTPLDRVSEYRESDDITVLDTGFEAPGTIDQLQFNMEREITGNLAVRQAIAYALDKEVIADNSTFGQGIAAHSPIASTITRFHDPSFDIYAQDLETAEALLDEAGFPRGDDGTRFTLGLTYEAELPPADRAATLIAGQLAEIGIQVELERLDRGVLTQQVYEDFDFDMSIAERTTGPDPSMSIPRLYNAASIGGGLSNAMQYTNEELEEIFATEFTMVDEDERRDAWVRVQEIIMNDLPVIPLFEFPPVQVVRSGFCDVIIDPNGYLGPRERTYLVNN